MIREYNQKEIIIKLLGNDIENNEIIKEYENLGYSVQQISSSSSAIGEMFITCCYVLLKKIK